MTVVLCKVHVRFGENEIELEGDREFVQEAFRDFKDGFISMPVIQQIQAYGSSLSLEGEIESVAKVEADIAPPSLMGFLRGKGIKGFTDTALAIAVYLYQYRSQETFTKDDIEDNARKALLQRSTNINRDINNNRQKGYIEITDEKEEGLASFYVTQPGIDYVNSLRSTQ